MSRKKVGDPANNGAGTSDDATSFEKFESLTKRLVSVPKKEIDRRAKAHERAKRA